MLKSNFLLLIIARENNDMQLITLLFIFFNLSDLEAK